jgi:hypothetical protein
MARRKDSSEEASQSGSRDGSEDSYGSGGDRDGSESHEQSGSDNRSASGSGSRRSDSRSGSPRHGNSRFSGAKAKTTGSTSKTNGLPACDYGANCVRKNKDHWKEMWHPRNFKNVDLENRNA